MSATSPSPPSPPSPSPPQRRGPRPAGARRVGRARIAGIVLIAALLAVATTATASLHAAAALSGYTQHHGVHRRATVDAVHQVSHATSHSSWVSYDYDVTLAQPVGTARAAVAHDPTHDFQRFSPGATISVLVDPKQPSYAELPGLPVQNGLWFEFPLILGIVVLGVVALVVVRARRRAAVT